MKNCTLNPLRGCGNCWFGTSVSVTKPSALRHQRLTFDDPRRRTHEHLGAADRSASPGGDLHARGDRSRAARHRVRVEPDRRDDEAIACSSQVADRDRVAGCRRRLTAADDTGRVRERGVLTAIVPCGDADTERPAAVSVPNLVVRVVRTRDLAAVVALGAAALPGERVGDGLLARPLAAVGLEGVADCGRARDRRLSRIRRAR